MYIFFEKELIVWVYKFNDKALITVINIVISALFLECHGKKLLFGKNAGKSRVVGV